jgi:hypothetical protein
VDRLRAVRIAGGGSLADVPGLLLAELRRARRGVVVLAVDGLPHATAAACWPTAELTTLASTVPSTSTTAWLTATTGVGPDRHGVPGMVYRVPRDGTLVCAVTGDVVARGPAGSADGAGLLAPHLTVFQRAAGLARTVVLGRELHHLTGPWAQAVLAGAERAAPRSLPDLAAAAADPLTLVEQVRADVEAELARVPDDRPALLWTYVNLDDHLHRHGPDDRALTALRRLGDHAEAWAAGGWTVVCHSDHGQVRCDPDPDLCAAWDDVERAECVLPSGGAGRLRWMYPRPGREGRVADRLARRLGEAAVVVPAARLAALGVPALDALRGPLLRGRVGAVVALAASEHFPVPDRRMRYEHGGLHPDETAVPYVTWLP